MITNISDFYHAIHYELRDFCSIENIEIKQKKINDFDINIYICEENYIADILTIGRIEEYLPERLHSCLPVGVLINIHVNVNFTSAINDIYLMLKL